MFRQYRIMERLHVLQRHLVGNKTQSRPRHQECVASAPTTDRLWRQSIEQLGVEISDPPAHLDTAFRTLLTLEAVQFLDELVREFQDAVDQMLISRQLKKLNLDTSGKLPEFSKDDSIRHSNWTVASIPQRLKCRHVDLGDVSPSNMDHFKAALKSTAQGIQTDFDDGHCPTWTNQLSGLYNVYRAIHGLIPGVASIEHLPVIMMRPRAWNMVESNVLVGGKQIPGPLFDFGVLMFHNAQHLLKKNSGPYFYLSKLEGRLEARVWDQIFSWTEKKLGLPHGCVKACVLIENVLASFEMEEILFELQDHSAGLNCGIWDYSASFINKFGCRKDFLLPDRNKYVSMDRHFLKSYMDLVVATCHHRGCPATGGMAASLLPDSPATSVDYEKVVESVKQGKGKEIKAGVDGFMVYDIRLLQPMQKLFKDLTPGENQYHVKRDEITITAYDLLLMPSGGVTRSGLKHNITVGILFIDSWLKGQGHFSLNGSIEDSATAEISRSQVWQCIRHQAILEEDGKVITFAMVQSVARGVVRDQLSVISAGQKVSQNDYTRLQTAVQMFLEIVTKKDFPEFITTYLSLNHTWLSFHQTVKLN
ncbi:malate synthase-like [Pecten maximus]|uniref:malate synthase-like n=1 Tax=Pecten maximus TaxID=6579 RepID=UPI001457E681|nr:malate synthase-like [Pecten maximus]